MSYKTKARPKAKSKNKLKSKQTAKSKTKSGSKIKSKTKPKHRKKRTAPKISKKEYVSIIISALLVVCLVLGAVVTHNHSNRQRSGLLDIDKDVAFGIDVSAHNGKIDWEKVSGEADFAFIRVGYRGYQGGALSADKCAKYNLKHAKRAGVPVGVYFYSQAITPEEAEQEADFVIDFIHNCRVTLPVVIDYEYAYDKGKLGGRLYNAGLGRNEGAEIISAFAKKVTNAGYTAGVYASTNFYEEKINVKKLDKNTVIWVADYNKNITYDGYYDIWQYSKSGSCDGVPSKHVDMNHWYLKETKS